MNVLESAALDNYWGVTGMDISMRLRRPLQVIIYSKRKLDMVPPHMRERYFSDYDQLRSQISADM